MQHRVRLRCLYDGCSRDFNTEADVANHVSQTHMMKLSQEELEKYLSSCESGLDRETLEHCSLCLEKNFRLPELQKHLGKHQEQLALFALEMNDWYELDDRTKKSGSRDAPQNDEAVQVNLGESLSRSGGAEVFKDFQAFEPLGKG